MKCIKCGKGDIFKYNVVRAKDKDHPAEKPVLLHKHILENIIKKDSTVLDPFMGTGSIGLACKELKCKKYIGIELEPSYFKIAEDKLRVFGD